MNRLTRIITGISTAVAVAGRASIMFISADRNIPELQSLQVGDTVRINREGAMPPPFTVAAIDPGHALVLRGGDSYTWTFVLKPIAEKTTRLIVRARAYTEPAWVAPLMYVEPITFFMEQKTLRGIKERAERP